MRHDEERGWWRSRVLARIPGARAPSRHGKRCGNCGIGRERVRFPAHAARVQSACLLTAAILMSSGKTHSNESVAPGDSIQGLRHVLLRRVEDDVELRAREGSNET